MFGLDPTQQVSVLQQAPRFGIIAQLCCLMSGSPLFIRA